jgi:hypothetical protein
MLPALRLGRFRGLVMHESFKAGEIGGEPTADFGPGQSAARVIRDCGQAVVQQTEGRGIGRLKLIHHPEHAVAFDSLVSGKLSKRSIAG